MAEKVVVSRLWSNPQINVFVSNTEVGASMELETFLRTLVDEIGNPTFMMTRKQLLDKLEQASEKIVRELKQATVHI